MNRRSNNNLAKSTKATGKPGLVEGSTLLSLESALETPLGRQMPSKMRTIAIKFAGGKTLQRIAHEEGIAEALAAQYLRYAVGKLHCRPVQLNHTSRGKATKTERRESVGSNQFVAEEVMIAAKCESCGELIGANEERMLVAAMEIIICDNLDEKGPMDEMIRPYPGPTHHYCLNCACKIEEFTVPNPWFRTSEHARAQAEWFEMCEAEEHAKNARREKVLAASVASGDMHAFNTAMPTTASPDDVMADAEQIEHAAGRAARKSNDAPNPRAISDMADNVMAGAVHVKPLRPEVASNLSGEATQRAKLNEYLNSAGSRNKLLPEVRNSLRMWVDGASQSEVARKFHVDQGTISKRIKAGLTSAYAQR